MLGLKECLKFLDSLNIEYRRVNHPAVYTINEVNSVNFEGKEKCVKNLFLRDDKKENYYLVVVEPYKNINMKILRDKIQSRRLSFASEEDLKKYLGLEKGAVTPLGIFNNIEKNVIVVFDSDISGEIGIHPLVNTCSIFLESHILKDLIKKEYKLIEVSI